MKKKALSLLLCVVMVFSLCSTAFASQPEYKQITGEYQYEPALDFVAKEDSTWTFKYSDEYFTHSGYEYDHDLAIMSLDLAQSSAASAFTGKEGWETSNRNFIDLMKKCEFTNIASSEFITSRPRWNTIGVNFASKHMVDDGKDYTLIAVGVRGHGYKQEWGSDFQLGYSGDHEGFANARDDVLAYIKEYIADYNITGNIKLWMAGYSRSAAASNLAGGAIDQGYSFGKNVKLDLNDLYCYTFETPQATADKNCRDSLYWNIHNVENHNDLVTEVSFTAWGHSRFGVDYYIPCRQYDACYAQLKPEVDALIGQMDWMKLLGITMNTIDNFHYLSLNPAVAAAKQNMTQIEFYPELFNALFDTIAPTRAYYVDNTQADLIELTTYVLGLETAYLPEALEVFGQKVTSSENVQKIFVPGADSKLAIDTIVDLFMESLQETGNAGYDGDQVRAMLKNMLPGLMKLIQKHPDTTMTLLGNIVQILNAHFPEIGRAWMEVTPAEFFEAQNPNYSVKATFEDVPVGCYCFDAVEWAVDKGIAKGYTDTIFAPGDPCTRAQVASFLWRAAGSPAPKSAKCPFVDVDANSPHYKAITWAAEKGITAGVDKTHFAPNDPCTRAQIVSFIYRYEGSPVVLGFCPFVDVRVTSPHYSAITWAAKKGIASGYDATHFGPNDTCTRAQVVSFLYRDMA